ncbi:hypothetical protein CNR22_05710 [Sphingobacteriaceae bacterium]|nr:hypothetical protein CNR22_05710 [Sphingobacteriaceae bacterium]
MKKIYPFLILVASLFCIKSFSQCSTPTTVPYYEGFEIITTNNQLPGCWAISNPSTCLTFTGAGWTGTAGAAFYYSPAQSSYFYSKAVQLYAGITYSTSAWYKVLSNTTITWTDFSILLGTGQSSTGVVTLASTNGAAVNMIYSPVSGTFAVASSGVYYFAVRGISNGVSGSSVLYWDGFNVIIPCTISANTPSVTVVANTNSICQGQNNFTATASGADSYLWFDGTTAPTNTSTNSSFFNTSYSVVGTSTLTGCSSSAAVNVSLFPSPPVIVTGSKPSVCLGDNITLVANGANSYLWSNGAISAVITVTPSAPSTYTVVGTNASGCKASAEYSVIVNPLPVINYSVSALTPTVCKGETVSFKAEGAVSYQWFTNQGLFSGSSFSLEATSATTVNLTGTGANGCFAKAVYVLNVAACTGIKRNEVTEFKIYPNPGKGQYILDSGSEDLKTIVIKDFTGKIVSSSQSSSAQIKINLEQFCAGIYNINISSLGKPVSIKLIKE